MNRILYMLEYALLSLSRRWKKQLALTLIYALVVSFFASVVFFTASLRKEAQVATAELPEIWVQKLKGGRLANLDTGLISEMGSIRGVKKVLPRIWGYLFDTPTGAVFTVSGTETFNMEESALITGLQGVPDSTEVICGTGFLELRGLEVGDRMTVVDSEGELRSFTIKAAFSSKTDLLTKDLLIFHNDQARQLLGIPKSEVTDLAIEVYNPAEVANIGKKLDRAYGGIRVVTKAELAATYEALFSWRGGIFVYGSLISVLAFLILAWDRAAGLGSNERKELGILKGIGWGIGDILWMKLWEGAAISVLATLLGLLLAFLHVFFLEAPLLKPFFVGWSVMYPAYELQPAIGLGDLLIVVLIAVVPYLSATVVPAWLGAATDPAEVIRGG